MGKIVKELSYQAVTYTATTNGASELILDSGHVPAKIHGFLNVTAASGTTPALDVKLQRSYDATNWTDVTSGAFAQATAVSVKELNGIAFIGGGEYLRYVATVGGTTPSFTFSLRIRMEA